MDLTTKDIDCTMIVQVWGGFGIVFIAIYTAKLAAFMVEIVETQTAANVHGIIVRQIFWPILP